VKVAQRRPTAKTTRSSRRVVSSGAREAVRVKLLGGFSVSVGDRAIERDEWRLKKAAALVKLLALAPGHRLHREQAMDLLWPDVGKKAASNSLRRTLHAARRTLDPAEGSGYMASEDESLVLCPGGDLWIDVDAFEQAAATARRSREPAAHRAALDLYAGEILPEDRYEGWAEGRREELRHLRLALLVELAELYEEHGDFTPAIEVLQKIIADGPTNEEAHAHLMRLYALSGREGDALAQYERLRDTLSRQLSAEPSTTTRKLREDIAVGRFPMTITRPADSSHEDTLGTTKHNLPAPRSSFVGRGQEIVEIKRKLAMTRLLTLTGAGGSGKTRLALEVARDLVGAYLDGVWLVELAPLSKDELVPRAVADVLAVPERPQEPLSDTLSDVLRDREMLLVLDNCEHLVEATARLVDVLLDSCAGLRVLATSREALGVEGEIKWPVPPLSVPERGHAPSLEELEGYESIRLFVERARGHDPSFSLDPQKARVATDICRTLEGIPLAIELAAARAGTLSLERISQRLEGSIELLTHGSRTASARQRTLRGTLDWSHDLLSEPEKVLFRRLSVFAGRSTLEALEVVACGKGVRQNEVMDLLSGLVEKSLVVARVSELGGVRYRLLEPIRQYALEKLDESGEADDIKRSHTQYFLALTERAEPELVGPREEEWLDRIEEELDNFRAALSWALERGDTEFGLRLAGALRLFWLKRRHAGEGRRWLEEALAREGGTSTMALVKALGAISHVALWQGDLDRAKGASEAGLRLSAEAGVGGGHDVALFTWMLAVVSSKRGDPEQATKLAEESLALSRQANDAEFVGSSLLVLGWSSDDRGDHERAEKFYEEGVVLSRESGSTGLLSISLDNLGWAFLTQGDPERAKELFEEAVTLVREVGDTADPLLSLGWVALLGGDLQQAKALYKESLTLCRELGAKAGAADSLEWLACVSGAEGEARRAARLFGAAEALREALDIRMSPDERTLEEPYLLAARSQLDGGTWEELWEEGRAISMEAAIEYALSEEGPTTLASQAPNRQAADARALYLTTREEEVVALVAKGLTNRQIAARLVIAESTAETHLARIFKKLGLRSRTQLTVWANDRGHSSSS
jgi:predicted ATPase/DNA-binding SARP family transcriptional activator/DNA-binding CsgD family transcriptional regulator